MSIIRVMLSKPVSTATQTALNAKEPTITSGTTAQYYRGDKTFQTLNTGAVPSVTNSRYVTDAQLTVISNTSGTNTGDQVIPTSLPPNGSAGGDLAGSYPNPTLGTITTAATVGSASAIPIITYDAKGRITSTTTAAISGGGGGTVTNVSSATADATISNPTTTPVITVVSAPKLTTARNINGVSFDGTANITVADATKEPVISAGTTGQYYRGDKTFQTLNQDAVPDGTTNKAYTASR
jgi:hypothetical protein